MADILSQGTERPPSWRLVSVTVVTVAAMLAILVARHLPHDVIPAHRPAPAVASGPVQLAGLGSGAAALLNQGSGSPHACTPHAQVPTVTAPETARSRLRTACSTWAQRSWRKRSLLAKLGIPSAAQRSRYSVRVPSSSPQSSGQARLTSHMSIGSGTHKAEPFGSATLPHVTYHARLVPAQRLVCAEFQALHSYYRAEL